MEKKEGIRAWGQDILQVTDLPGIYSLTTYSAEEKIACDFFIRNTPDVIINVVDATNLERNLYFTLQLRELGLPIVVALNMADILEKRGVRIDCRLFNARLFLYVQLPDRGFPNFWNE